MLIYDRILIIINITSILFQSKINFEAIIHELIDWTIKYVDIMSYTNQHIFTPNQINFIYMIIFINSHSLLINQAITLIFEMFRISIYQPKHLFKQQTLSFL